MASKEERERLKRLKKEQENRMMEFDVPPAKTKKEKKLIDKAAKRFDSDASESN